MITLPKLPSEFTEFGGCLTFETSDASLIAWVEQNTIVDACATFSGGGQARWLEVTLNSWTNSEDGTTSHLHVETTKNRPKSAVDDKLHKCDDLVEMVSVFIEKAATEAPTIVSRARIVAPRLEIPSHGIIGRLLNFHQSSCGASFEVENAGLKIEDEVFTRMTFQDLGETVSVDLWAESEIVFHSEYLVHLVELMRIGADCYVFERSSREVTNV